MKIPVTCRNLGHAQSTVVAYWSNYIKDAILKTDLETLAKVHNGKQFSQMKRSILL